MTISVIFDIINKASAPLKTVENSFDRLGKRVKNVSECLWKFNQTSELLEKMGSAVEQISAPYREFEQGVADLSAITGIAGRELEGLSKYARSVGVESGLGATGAIEAFKLLASQIQVDKIGIEGLKTLQQETITLAQASGMSMADAANSMAGTINQFGLEATEANRVINVLAAGSKYGAAEIPELAQSFKVVGAAANAAGLTIESTAGALEVLSKNNLKGAEAGTALRNIMLKMQTSLGVDFTKTSLSEALEGLTPKYKDAAYMAKLFGVENVAAAQFLVANAKEVEEMTSLVTDTNVATEQAAITTNTWNHRLKVQTAWLNEQSMKLTETIPGIMSIIQLGSQGLGMLTSLAPLGAGALGLLKISIAGVTSTAKGIASLPRAFGMLNLALKAGNHQTYTALIARYGVVGRVAAAGLWMKNTAVSAGTFLLGMFNAQTRAASLLQIRETVTTKVSAIWTGLLNGVRTIGAGIMSLWNKRTLVTTAIQKGLSVALMAGKFVITGGFIPAMMGAISSTWAWTAALLANPITWIVIGIGALIAAIVMCWNKFAEFRAVILTIWETVKGFGLALIQFLVAPFKAVFEMISGIAGAIGKIFSGDFKGAWAEIKEGGKGVFESFAKPVKTVANAVTNIPEAYNTNLQTEKGKEAKKVKKVPPSSTEPEANNLLPAGFTLPGLDLSFPEVPDIPSVSGFDIPGMPTFDTPGSSPLGEPTKPLSSAPASPLDVPTRPIAPQAPILTPPEMPQGDGINQINNASERQAITINYNPQVTISQDVSEKGKQDILAMLKAHATEIARLVKEEMRKEARGNYGLSTIG